MNIGALLFGVGGLIFLAWLVIVSASTVKREEVDRLTFAGWIKVWLMRAAAPLFAGVSKSAGIKKVAATVTSLRVPSEHGAARVAIYRPPGTAGEILPVHINFHGGGFVVGFAQQDDLLCRHIANHARCAVINVDYALAPEHPFPTAILQSYEVVKWITINAAELMIDPGQLTIGGFSAGGGIVAALVLLAKDQRDFNVRLQILAYPALDFSWIGKHDVENADKSTSSSALTPGMMDFFRNIYLPVLTDRTSPLASPALERDNGALPRALIITAQRDLVTDAARRYATRLGAAGVAVTYREFADCEHGFTHSGPALAAQEALKLMTQEIQEAGNRTTRRVPLG